MKKFFEISAVCLFTAITMCCCKPLEDAFGVDDPEQYSMVYMPLAVNGTMTYDLAIDEAQEEVVSIYANIGGLVKTESDLAVTFRLEKDSLDVYNSRNNTEYGLLPEDSYEFKDSVVTIPAGKTCSSAPAVVAIHSANLQEGRYLLPVKLVSIEGGDYPINEDKSLLYIMVNARILKNSKDYPENYPLVYATSAIVGEITTSFDDPLETTVDITAIIGGSEAPAEAVEVTFKVDEEYLETYNEENQSSFRLLPTEAYGFDEGMTVTIPAGSMVSDALSVSLNSESLVGGPFLLPLRISETSGGDYGINEHNDMVVLKLRLEYEPCAGRENWTLECPNTEPSQGAVEYLFDGLPGTFWCTKWKDSKPGPPHVLTLDLGTNYEVHGLAFTARSDVDADGNVTKVRDGMIHRCEVSLSYDKSAWTSAGEFELPAISLKKIQTELFFDRAFYGRYVRITVTSCYYANGTTGFYQCGISELDLYGRQGEDPERKAVMTVSVSPEERINIRSAADVYDREVKVKAVSDLPAAKDETVTFTIDPDYVQEYNSANGTSYIMLDAEAYSADRLTVTIPAGARESEEVTLTLKPSKMHFGEFMLPLTASAQSSFFGDQPEVKTQILLVYAADFDRTGWKAASDRTEPNEQGWEARLFDGDITTHWGTQWKDAKPGPPHELIITMNEVKTVSGIAFSARVNLDENKKVKRIRDGVIKECEIFFSSDETEEKTWESAGVFTFPYVTMDNIENRVFFDKTYRGKFIKVYITKCYREGGAEEFYQCQISEINVF